MTVPRADDLAEAMDRVGHHAVGGERIGAPGHQALRLGQIVVAIAEEALGETRAHLLGFGADRAVRVVVGGAEDLRQRAIQQFGRGRRVAAADVRELVRLVVLRSSIILSATSVERLVPA